MPVLPGSSGHDSLTGTGHGDLLQGLAGYDTLDGGEGNDTLDGGLGLDRLVGGAGFDLVSYAGASSGVSVDLLFGSAWGGDDSDGLADVEAVLGTAFSDTINGDYGVNHLEGGAGDDSLFGGGGSDTLIGGEGNDTLTASGAADRYTGGDGADLFTLVVPAHGWSPDAPGTMDVVTDFSAAEGDRLQLLEASRLPARYPPGTYVLGITLGIPSFGPPPTPQLDGPGGRLPLLWGGAIAPQAALAAGLALPGEDVAALAYTAAWVPDAAGGGWVVVDLDRSASLSAGDQVLRFLGAPGSPGIGIGDFVTGTFTNHTEGTVGNDRIVGTGTNTVLISNFFLADTPLPVDFLSGGEGDDTLIGGIGHDTLVGGAGADRLRGGAGGDTYLVDRWSDVVVEDAGAGGDTVLATSSFRLPANVEALILASGAGDIQGVGNTLANRISGNEGANRIAARDGTDWAGGGPGDDTLLGQFGNDTLAGGDGADLLHGGDGADSLDGGTGADRLYGGAGDDSLSGGGGDDTLNGMGSRDALFGGAGADTFVFQCFTGAEVIGDFTPGIDRIRLPDPESFGLSGPPATCFAALQTTMVESGGSTTIVLIDADSVRLVGVPKSALSAGDFLFS